MHNDQSARSVLNARAAPNEASLCQEACGTILVGRAGLAGCGAGRRVVGLAATREWLFRRAGGSGCEPAALDAESFPGCPPGSLVLLRICWRVSLTRRW